MRTYMVIGLILMMMMEKLSLGFCLRSAAPYGQ